MRRERGKGHKTREARNATAGLGRVLDMMTGMGEARTIERPLTRSS